MTSTARATSQLDMVIIAMANNSTYFMVFLRVGGSIVINASMTSIKALQPSAFIKHPYRSLRWDTTAHSSPFSSSAGERKLMTHFVAFAVIENT